MQKYLYVSCSLLESNPGHLHDDCHDTTPPTTNLLSMRELYYTIFNIMSYQVLHSETLVLIMLSQHVTSRALVPLHWPAPAICSKWDCIVSDWPTDLSLQEKLNFWHTPQSQRDGRTHNPFRDRPMQSHWDSSTDGGRVNEPLPFSAAVLDRSLKVPWHENVTLWGFLTLIWVLLDCLWSQSS